MTQTHSSRPAERPEPVELEALEAVYHDLPIWGPLLIVAISIALNVALPNKLRLGPRWLLPGLEALLLVGLAVASPSRRARHYKRRRTVVLTLAGLVSATNAVSLALLVHYLVSGGHDTGKDLIYSGALLWINNVLVFGLWYWELDRGGPVERMRHTRDHPDFLFVQMSDPDWAPKGWMPSLVDYLYLSFTNSTAFSPTDTMPLTPMAKWLMAGQSLVALVTVGLVVARAVNILG
ncbi:MAG TPA: hypothetical protein VH279_02205 [Solirubrobacteraceae bacterium]|jgi:hypothetical protein|nr:hypothetical protein [Solirubrobacteraceae bacterium]